MSTEQEKSVMAIQIERPETKIEHAQVSFVGLKASRVASVTWAIGGSGFAQPR
jgi:hypothetical protein